MGKSTVRSERDPARRQEIEKVIAEIESGRVVVNFPRFRSLGSLEIFIALMRKENHFIVSEAAKEVGRFGAQAEEPLLELLGEPDRGNTCHLEAVRCLRRVGTTRAIPKLYEQLQHHRRMMQNEAIKSLAEIWKRCGTSPDIGMLLRMFRSAGDSIVRDTVLKVMVDTRAREAFDEVRRVIRKADSPREIPGSVIRAYGALGGAAVADDLEAILRDPNYLRVMELYRREVAKVAGNNIKVGFVQTRFDYEGWKNVRRAAVDSLAEIAGPRAMPVLLSVVAYDPIAVVRERAEAVARDILLAAGKDPAKVKLEAGPLVPGLIIERPVPQAFEETEEKKAEPAPTPTEEYAGELPASIEDRIGFAKNPDTPAAALEALLADNPPREVKIAAARNPGMSLAVFRALVAEDDDRIKARLAVNLTSADPPNLPGGSDRITGCLLEILEKAGPSVAAMIARGRNVPEPVLRVLMSHEEEVRFWLAHRRDLSREMVEELYRSGTAKVRRALISNRDVQLPESEYPIILESTRGEESENWRLRVGLAGKANLGALLIRELARDDLIRVRTAVARRSGLPRDVRESLAADPAAFVRAQIMENPDTPLHLLRRLDKDDIPLSEGLRTPGGGAVAGFLSKEVQILERRGETVRDRLLAGPGILRSPAVRILMPFFPDSRRFVEGSAAGEAAVTLRMLQRDRFADYLKRVKDGSRFIDFRDPRGLADPVKKEIVIDLEHPAHIDKDGTQDMVGIFRTLIHMKTHMLIVAHWSVLEDVAYDLRGRTYEQDQIIRHFYAQYLQDERESIQEDDRDQLRIDPLWNCNRTRGKEGAAGRDRTVSFPRIISELLAVFHEYSLLPLLSRRLKSLRAGGNGLRPNESSVISGALESIAELLSSKRDLIASTRKAREDLHLIDLRITGDCIFPEHAFTAPILLGEIDPAMLPFP